MHSKVITVKNSEKNGESRAGYTEQKSIHSLSWRLFPKNEISSSSPRDHLPSNTGHLFQSPSQHIAICREQKTTFPRMWPQGYKHQMSLASCINDRPDHVVWSKWSLHTDYAYLCCRSPLYGCLVAFCSAWKTTWCLSHPQDLSPSNQPGEDALSFTWQTAFLLCPG